MQSARPDIPQNVNPGEPVKASLINQLIGLAGYFQDMPIDAVVPGDPIYIGRPALMRIESVIFTGSTPTVSWDNGGGRVYGLVNANVLEGGQSGASPTGSYSQEKLNDEEWPGVCISEINGGNFADEGDLVIGYPIQTPIGLAFMFEGTRSQLYRVDTPVEIIADRKWSYSLVPQLVDSDGVTWSDDPYGVTLIGAMNEAEILNTAGSTLQGNDVDFSVTTTGTLQPIKENHMVEITRFTKKSSGPKIAWFNALNLVTC